MRINEIANNVKKFFELGKERDEAFNADAARFARQNAEHYKNGVGVIRKPLEEKDKFSNQPHEIDLSSPGYKGLQSIKKLIGQDYDGRVLNDSKPLPNPTQFE